MTKQELSNLETAVSINGYTSVVKVNAAGETLVVLRHPRDGHVFEGKATRTVSDGYGRALDIAVRRMNAYVNRFA